MASERQLRANLKNARRSTGPRTAAGKASASRNSLRHGLAVDIRNDPALCKDIENLAQQYCGDMIEPHRLLLARTAAEAQCAINRVRQARVALIEHAAVDHENFELTRESGLKINGDISLPDSIDRDDQTHLAICRIAQMLLRLDRYERRALSRRKRALRDLFLE